MHSIILHLVRSIFPTNTAVAIGQVKTDGMNKSGVPFLSLPNPFCKCGIKKKKDPKPHGRSQASRGKPALQQFAQACASLYFMFQTLLSLDIRRIVRLCAANLLFYLEDFLKEICKIVLLWLYFFFCF